jgi:amino acid transporter
MIIGGAVVLALIALFGLLLSDNSAECARLLVGWRKVCAALIGGVLVQALLLPMLPGFFIALFVAMLRPEGDELVPQLNMLICNMIIYGHIIYYYLGRTHRRRQARLNYNPLP